MLGLLTIGYFSYAQMRDTTYIESYEKMLTTRVYFSQKYTSFALEGSQGFRELHYRPNTNLSFGIGATYRALTFNMGYGFSFLNPDKGKGKTKYIDLQTHIYGAKWKYDIYAQFYKGYYLNPRGFGIADKNSFYKRSDILVNELGVSAYHIYNSKQFSYRAAFTQSEWQKKSAGTFLLGGSVTLGGITADSALVPASLSANYPQSAIKSIGYIEFGPGAGYAYTFVWKENWFFSATATILLDIGIVAESSAASNTTSSHISPNLMLRAGLGYNSRDWNINFYWVNNRTTLEGQFPGAGYSVNTGSLRLTVAKRLVPWPELRRILNRVDRLLDGKKAT